MLLLKTTQTLLILTLTIAALTRAAHLGHAELDDRTNKSINSYAWQGDHGWSCNKASANAKHIEIVPLTSGCGSTNNGRFLGKTHAWMGSENTCMSRVTDNGITMDPFARNAALVICAGADVDGQDDRTIVIEWWPHHDCRNSGEGGGPDGPYTIEVNTNSGVCIDPRDTPDHTGKANNNIFSLRWHFK